MRNNLTDQIRSATKQQKLYQTTAIRTGKYIFLLYKHQWNTRWAFARKHDMIPLLWLHNKSRLSQEKNCFGEMVWYFIGVYIINRTLHGRLEIRNFSSRVENISLVRCAHSWNIFQHSKLLEEKFRISAWPWNILCFSYIIFNLCTILSIFLSGFRLFFKSNWKFLVLSNIYFIFVSTA